MSETNRIEYKRELTSELDIEKEVVAFLNYKEGGYIYIGIDKDGSTVGVNDVDVMAISSVIFLYSFSEIVPCSKR